ncbi:MAG: hypothetical protein ACK4F9_00865 [Brevinematia bacterium]
MDKIIAEVGNHKISFEEFINTFFYLLIGYSISNRSQKISKSDIEKFSKIIFDLTLESVIQTTSVKKFIEDSSTYRINTSENTSEGEEVKEMITTKLSLLGNENFKNYLDAKILQEIVETQIFISNFIESYLQKEGILSYDKIKEFYNKEFIGFLLISFLFVSIPKTLKEEEKEEIKRKINGENLKEMEKFYEKDPQKIVYYYENIDVFDYFTTTKEFENEKSFRLYEILEGIGVDPDNMILDKNIENKIVSIQTDTRDNFYKFTQIDYNKPQFSTKIYEYFKEYLLDNLYDETFDILYDKASEKIPVKYYEDNLKELQKILRPISKEWFENIR